MTLEFPPAYAMRNFDIHRCRDSGKFDSTQLAALKEFLPTDEERIALSNYLKKGETSPESMTAAMADLSECEKYMAAMMKVENAASKFDCMLFRVQFEGRLNELIEGINIITKACDEVRSSERLRKMMAMILTLVNQINTGGDGNLAIGFSLDALLKLNEVRRRLFAPMPTTNETHRCDYLNCV